MQQSWRDDHDKLTFIACLPSSDDEELVAGICDAPDRMVGDVNLFLSPADEDPEGCIGELERKYFTLRIRERLFLVASQNGLE